MKNNKLQNGIEDIKKITMTAIEKKRIFESVLDSSLLVHKSKVSPWMSFSLLASINNRKLVYYIIVPLIIILTSSGVVFASQDSLPDSPLYPIKVNIVEPVIEALSFSPEAKAKYESKLASNRLTEAETLANQNKLTPSREDKINNLLIKHTNALDQALRKVDVSTGSSIARDTIATDFHVKMDTQAKALDKITREVAKKSNKKNVDNNVNTNIGGTNVNTNTNTNTDTNNIDRTNININTDNNNTNTNNIKINTDNIKIDNIKINTDNIDNTNIENNNLYKNNKISETAILSAEKINSVSSELKIENSNRTNINKHRQDNSRKSD